MTTEFDDLLYNLASKIGAAAQPQNLLLTTAESCTGGWLSQVITSVPGSSAWFERGFVTYSNAAKHDMLKVKKTTLNKFGAVSEQTALAMAEGALTHSRAQISVAITGIAGPTGGDAEKPVGTVWLGLAGTNKPSQAAHCLLQGNRHQVRGQAVRFALEELLSYILR